MSVPYSGRIHITHFTAILLIIFLSACGGGKGNAPSDPISPVAPAAEKLTFSGIGDLGIFDPSITLDPSSGRLWMSYSSVNTSPNYSSSVYWAVSTRLAYSDDDGLSWQDAGVTVSPSIERTDFGLITPLLLQFLRLVMVSGKVKCLLWFMIHIPLLQQVNVGN